MPENILLIRWVGIVSSALMSLENLVLFKLRQRRLNEVVYYKQLRIKQPWLASQLAFVSK